MIRFSRFTVEPNPPVAGQPATITYTGDAKEVIWTVWGNAPRKVRIPPNKFTIDPVPSGESLAISDDSGEGGGDDEWPVDNPR